MTTQLAATIIKGLMFYCMEYNRDHIPDAKELKICVDTKLELVIKDLKTLRNIK